MLIWVYCEQMSFCLASPWMEPGKLGPTQEHAAIVTCRSFSGRGVTILLVSERQYVDDYEWLQVQWI